MLTVGFDCCGHRHQAVGVSIDCRSVGHCVLARGEGSGLVEQHRVDLAHPLQSKTVLHEDAVSGSYRRRQGNDKRDGEPQRMRAGDDQHGHGPDQRLVGFSQEQPDDCGDRRRSDGDVEQQRRCTVSDRLSPRLRFLSLTNEPLNPTKRSVVADGCDLDSDGVVGCDRASDHVIAFGLRHWIGFSGEHRLVDLDAALDDPAIRGHSTSRPNQQPVADRQIADRNRRHISVVADAFSFVRKQFGQCSECSPGLTDRLHLLPMTKEHDHDEARKLPPEFEIEDVGQRQDRCAEGNGDRQGDQQHHARLALLGFVVTAG